MQILNKLALQSFLKIHSCRKWIFNLRPLVRTVLVYHNSIPVMYNATFNKKIGIIFATSILI
jgi:hypothetical protein